MINPKPNNNFIPIPQKPSMKYPTESALQNHFLCSILPTTTLTEQKQIQKTKDFYQPEKLIWNIQHRTSSRMYPYYHKLNDNYALHKEPVIKNMEEEDRKRKEDTRIRRLLNLRNQTRNRFYGKKNDRITLETKCFSQSRRFSTLEIDRSGKRPFPNFNPRPNISSTLENHDNFISHVVMRPEKSYQQGLIKQEERNTQIEHLIFNQRQKTHNKIHLEFEVRKHSNQEIFEKIKKSTIFVSKLT